MNDQNEKQAIEEMARALCRDQAGGNNRIDKCSDCVCYGICIFIQEATRAYSAGYRKQSEGEWEWFEEWNPSTTEHPRECNECGWRCGECKTALADIVGGYWDDPDEKPNLHFCPDCGAKMKGEKNTEKTQKKHFSPEDVRKMSQKEVRENYTAIINSMKEWK